MNNRTAAIDAARDAGAFALKRVLLIAGIEHKNMDIAVLRADFMRRFGGNPLAVSALDGFFVALANAQQGEAPHTWQKAVRNWLIIAGDLAETLIPEDQPMKAPA